MSKLLEGKVILVTGAGAGVGKGIAMEAARQGAKVIVNDLGVAIDGSGASAGPAQVTCLTKSRPSVAKPSPTPTAWPISPPPSA